MTVLKVFALAGAAVVTTLPALAADLPIIRPMPMPVVEEFASGWYLRGDIGMSSQQVKKLDNVLFEGADQLEFLDKGGFDSAPIFGVGIGYQLNSWLRFDATLEYRGKAGFHALDRFFNAGMGSFNSNEYTASKSEWVGMVNGYVDLGSWWGMTPFVGAGVGFAQNRISHFRDVNVPALGVAYGAEATKTGFAWALHAGVGYRITPNTTIEFAYRYIDLGDAQSGDLTTYTGVSTVDNPMLFKGITSHDFKMGVRYLFGAPEPVYAPPPLVRKG